VSTLANKNVKSLVLQCSELFNVKSFVETGTLYGETTRWAAKTFEYVHTIELSEKLYQDALEKHKKFKNIHHYLGNSLDTLPRIVNTLDNSTLFWLDAHWSGGVTAKSEVECPLIAE